MLKISKITPMEIIVIVCFFTYYSCSCSFKSARFVLIYQSMHFGTAFSDCNSIKDDGHACGAMTYHDVIRSLRHVNMTPKQGAFFCENPKTDLWSQIIRILHCQIKRKIRGKKTTLLMAKTRRKSNISYEWMYAKCFSFGLGLKLKRFSNRTLSLG